MNFNKTALTVAICSSILAGNAIAADKYKKYNFSNQARVNVAEKTLNLDIKNNKPTAWVVKLNVPSLADSSVKGKLSKKENVNVVKNINKAQQSVINTINQLGGVEVVAQTKNLIAGVIVKGSEQKLLSLLANPTVADVLPLYDRKLNVAASAEYMGGKALVEAGIASGQGMRVAILDTGIDYTHAAFGGPGTVEAYDAAASDPADTPEWPQGQVVGGYDFVNNDPDPIDVDTIHGTHVAHSVTGLAPDVELYVYSVCNSGCPGIAQYLALEAAMDPNGDGDISDRVDVINMSLGGSFGTTRGGAVQEALDRAVMLGVNAAVSAGNDGPTPFIVGGPSTTKNVMSVGAMTHPTEESGLMSSSFNGNEIITRAAGFNKTLEFSFTDAETSIVYPESNQEGCDPFAEEIDFTGKIVLIDRGSCFFTTKVKNAQDKGAVFVLIANNKPDEGAPGLGGSDDTVTIPSAGISYEDGLIIKEALKGDESITFSFVSQAVVTAGAIASFTSRGPSSDGWLKPEITAPGVNILTASPGTGDGLTPISGTSFSGPMTAGSMALLREALPNRNALEIKATLMNTANLDVTMEPRAINPDAALAPISYIGSGLVDVQKAANLPVAAWDKNTKQAALAFGLMNLSATTSVTKTVTVKNFSASTKTYSLSLEQRYADDAETGAVSFDYPSSVNVPAGGSVDFEVTLTVDPTKLPAWTLDANKLGSPEGSNDLTTLEFDGALTFTDGDENFHLVYHVLPKASASVDVAAVITDEGVKRYVTNNGVKDLSAFTVPLTASDETGDSDYLDLEAASIEVLEVPDSFCPSGYSIFTTLVMADGMLTSNVGGFYADFDLDGDGSYDHFAQALPLSAFGSSYPDGVTITLSGRWDFSYYNIGNAYFDSGNNFITLQSCISDLDLSPEDLGTLKANVRFRISESQWDFVEDTGIDFASASNLNLSPSNEIVMLVDEDGQAIDTLAVGEKARLLTAGEDFVMLSDSGSQALVATPTQEAGVAPTVIADQTFAIDENTDTGTVIGMVQATDPDLYTSPVSEYYIQSSNSAAVTMDRDGTLKVADKNLLDYDAGLTSITLEVIAIDSVGNISEPETVIININNLKDEPSELPQPEPERVKKGGGSFGWLSLVLLPLAWRRRKQK